jgi:hypothetical protein
MVEELLPERVLSALVIGDPGGPVVVVMPEAWGAALSLAKGTLLTARHGACVSEERFLESIALALFPGGIEFAEAVGEAAYNFKPGDFRADVVVDGKKLMLCDGTRIAVLRPKGVSK